MIVEYLKGVRFFKRMHSSHQPINVWVLVSCHPGYSHTWHWALYWYAPGAMFFRWWSLGFRFKKQKILHKRN